MIELKRINNQEMTKIQQPILQAHGYTGIYEAFRAVAQAQLEADQETVKAIAQEILEEIENKLGMVLVGTAYIDAWQTLKQKYLKERKD